MEGHGIGDGLAFGAPLTRQIGDGLVFGTPPAHQIGDGLAFVALQAHQIGDGLSSRWVNPRLPTDFIVLHHPTWSPKAGGPSSGRGCGWQTLVGPWLGIQKPLKPIPQIVFTGQTDFMVLHEVM